ncbi:MAG: DUF4331 domain-containing protein [Planctomycetes bacterium]|nr:DUF4331 domain-containing protein [Planctomycetota bacterium]
MKMHRLSSPALASAVLALLGAPRAQASSHMDAPLITIDDAANTTDVYAFVSSIDGAKYLTTAVSVYPFEDPGIGPNKYNFDDNVSYRLHVCLGDDLAAGRPTLTYELRFRTTYRTQATVLQSYLGVIQDVGDSAQNLIQSYTVTCTDARARGRAATFSLVPTEQTLLVPPNNQGIATPRYNTGDSGANPAKDGVPPGGTLDAYTAQTVYTLNRGYRVFAGQREDGFYGDIQAIFDLLALRSPAKDSQKGFNVHTIALAIPMSELGGDQQQVGVFVTTHRPSKSLLRDGAASRDARGDERGLSTSGKLVQVGRQGNPLFCEGLIAIQDKDFYNRTLPTQDAITFRRYAEEPELASLLNALVVPGSGLTPAITTGRTDIGGIFIPDVIKVDLSTSAARLAGGGPSHPTTPDEPGFSRLSIFGGDTLQSALSGGAVPGGWPNGRRFGDDVVDIAVSALLSDLRMQPLFIQVAGDGASANDAVYHQVFPYAGTPHNGRNHSHDG